MEHASFLKTQNSLERFTVSGIKRRMKVTVAEQFRYIKTVMMVFLACGTMMDISSKHNGPSSPLGTMGTCPGPRDRMGPPSSCQITK
ncbi:hypothetical protein EVAR_13822_1 [Eumeta japonica]|uniref:Uncharacterized protein n=1 Tax=Eumeta variegata TaxID=151549 RepID=A0A4C1U1X1_EUMVA|nr:hypothetical protein EVAR_13822_1 [Eumeta japonica]